MLTKYIKSLNQNDFWKLKQVAQKLDKDKLKEEKDRLDYDNYNIPPYNLINSKAYLDTPFLNTCWFDSILYVLFNLKEFATQFSYPHVLNVENNNALSNQIYYLMKQLQNEENKKISTRNLYLNLKAYHTHDQDDLYNGRFQSAPDFFQFLISDLVTELQAEWLHTMFYIAIHDNEYCCQCKGVYQSSDLSGYLIRISVPDKINAGNQSITLYDCIYRHLYVPQGKVKKREKLCPSCHHNKTFSMFSFPDNTMPDVLVIALYRGFIHGESNVTVNYPYLLDYHKLNSECYSKIYMLKAVIICTGAHYYSYVRAFSDQKWYKMDGKKITLLTEKDFKENVMNNKLATMLFYEQIDDFLLNYDTEEYVPNSYPNFMEDEKLFKEYMIKQKEIEYENVD